MSRWNRVLGRFAPVFGLLVGTGACGVLDPPPCDAVFLPGIEVSLRDASHGGDVPAEGVFAEARSGEYADTAVAFQGNRLELVDDENRPGEYNVEVRADGYQPWVARDITVRQENKGCPMTTHRLRADLQPVG